jgi:hypothetical protein
VNQALGTKNTTVKLADDVRAKLAEWARTNISSMTAELNRSVRERAERERNKEQRQCTRVISEIPPSDQRMLTP